MSAKRLFALLLSLLLLLLPLPSAVAQEGGGQAAPAKVTLAADPAEVPPGGTAALVAVVEDAYGQPVPNVQVDFSVAAGTVDPASAVTDDQGQAKATFTAPQEPGQVTVAAQVYGTDLRAEVTVTVRVPQPPQQPTQLKVVEVTPAPGSEIDPDAEVRVKFDRPVVLTGGELAAYNLNGSGVSFEWGEVDPADPTAVKLKKPCGFPAGQVTLSGIPPTIIRGHDGAELPEKTPDLTYMVRPKAPNAVKLSPEPGTKAYLRMASTIGGGYAGYARPDQLNPAVEFDIPVEVADPSKVELTVRTPLYERTWTGTCDPADPAGEGGGKFLLAREPGNRLLLGRNYDSLSVLGPAFQGTLALRFLPGAVRHFGSGQDGLNAEAIELVIEVNPPVADGAYMPGSSPPAVEAKALSDPKVAWEAPLPGGNDTRVRGIARGAGFVVASTASGMAAYDEATGKVLWEVPGWFSAPVVGPDGGVYAVRGDDSGFYLERYNPDGTLAWSCYLPGEIAVPGEVPAPPQFLPDGDILYAVGDSAVGLSSGTALVVWRFSPDGRLKGAWDLTDALGGNATWANASCKLALHGHRAVVATGSSIAVVDFSSADLAVLGKVPIQAGATAGNVVCLHADATGFYAAQDAGFSGAVLYAFGPDGALRWNAQLPAPLGNKGYMVVSGGKLYYAGYTVDLASGAYEETRLPLSPGGTVERVAVLGACADGMLVYSGASVSGTEYLVFGSGGEVKLSAVLSWLRGKAPRMVTDVIYDRFTYDQPAEFGSLYIAAQDTEIGQTLLVKLSDQQQPPPPPPQPVPVRLEVRPAEATVKVGESQQYRAYLVYSDGTERDVTEECTWSVSDPSVASVTTEGQGRGLATGLKAGRVDVIAVWQGQ